MITQPIWYEDFIVEASLFPTECRRLYDCGAPTALVDVAGDGNCLYYCLLQFLVFQQHKFTKKWEFKAKPVLWIRRKIRKWVEALLTKLEWMYVTMCDEDSFITDECDRIFSEDVDYYDGDMMRETGEQHFGDPIDCFAFAKRYQVVIVIYVCSVNVNTRMTLVLDGRLKTASPIQCHNGICPNIVQVSSDVLELVRYKTCLLYTSPSPRD